MTSKVVGIRSIWGGKGREGGNKVGTQNGLGKYVICSENCEASVLGLRLLKLETSA